MDKLNINFFLGEYIFDITENQDYIINIRNCRVDFRDYRLDDLVRYRYHMNKIFTNESESLVDFTIKSDKLQPDRKILNFSILTQKANLQSCKLTISVPPKVIIPKMTIICEGQCFIVSQGTNLTFTNLTMRRGHLYSNFV